MSTINVPDDEKTIQGAVNRAHDGDTVVVHGESEAEPTLYPEAVGFESLGQFTIEAEPRRAVTVLGFDTVDAGDSLTMDGFCVTGGTDVHAVYIASPHVTIRDFYILNAPWAAIYVSPNPDLPGGTIEGCHAYGCGTGFHTHGVGWRVLNNDIERLIRRGNRDADYMRGWGVDLLIKGNHLHGTTQDEIGTAHADGFQTFDNNGRRLHGLRFLENIVEDTHQGMIFEDNDEPGDVSDILIYNNLFRNCWGMGVYVKDGVRNVRVYHNLIQNIGNHGVFARRGAEVDVYANIFVDAGSNYHGDGSEGLTGSYNILNRQGHPYHSDPTDRVDVNPGLDVDGYQTEYWINRSPIGRIRPGGTEPEPEPEEGHEHPDYEDVHALHEAMIALKAGKDHVHPMSNESRLMFEMLARGNETEARQILDKLGE